MTANPRPDARASANEAAYVAGAAAVILGSLAFRLFLSASLPLIADEAYAVVVSRQPSLSYFDHPLLGFGFARAAAWLAGSEWSLVVRLPHVVLGALSGWLLFVVTRRAFGARAAFWAVVWYSVAPFFLVSGGHFVVPDGPLNFFLLATLWLVLPQLLGEQPARMSRWLASGLALGLALLSKYTAVLFGLGALIVLLSMPRGRRLLATPGPWAAGAVAVICIAPVVVWNAQNGWASFGFQSGRAVGGEFNPLNFLLVQLGQAGFLLPWVWLVALGMVIAGLAAPRAPAERVFAILAAVPIVLFDIVAVFGREILPHWSMPGFLFAFPLVGLWCARSAGRWRRVIPIASVVSALLVAALAFGVVAQTRSAAVTNALGLAGRRDFDWTFLGWSALAEDFRQRGIDGEAGAFIVPSSWLIGGKAGYALGPSVPVAEPLADPRHFAYVRDDRLAGRTRGFAVAASWPEDAEAAAADLKRLLDERYIPDGNFWLVAQRRSGEPAFVIVVQPVTPKTP